MTWSSAAWTSSASTPPQSPSCGRIQSRPYVAEPRMFGQDDPVAAPTTSRMTSTCGAGAQAPERAAVDVDDGRQRLVAGAGRARRSRRRSGRRRPGAWTSRISIGGEAVAASAEPDRASAGAAASPGGSTVESSIARGAVRREKATVAEPSARRAPAAIVWVTMSPSTSRPVGRVGRPRGVEREQVRTRPAAVRDRRDDASSRRSRRAVPARDHPAGQVACRPSCRSAGRGPGRGRRRGRRAAVGRRDEHGRAEVVERLRPPGRRSPRASGRPARPTGLVAQPAGARTSRGSAVPASPGASTSTAQIVVRGARSGSGPRSR